VRRVLACLLIAACGDAADAPDAAEAVDAAVAPDAPFVCDPVAQDCPEASEKCTLVTGDSLEIEPGCRPETGAVGLDQACTRGAGGLGDDDCAAGLFCTFIGVLPPDDGGTRFCRALCAAHADCGDGQRCARLVENPDRGFCGPSCEAFSTCPDAMTCGELYADIEGGLFDAFLVCRPVGAVATGQACGAADDCGADHVCFDPGLVGGNERCLALCDETHPCATGECQTLGSLSACL
jgi:hypothetical protein